MLIFQLSKVNNFGNKHCNNAIRWSWRLFIIKVTDQTMTRLFEEQTIYPTAKSIKPQMSSQSKKRNRKWKPQKCHAVRTCFRSHKIRAAFLHFTVCTESEINITKCQLPTDKHSLDTRGTVLYVTLLHHTKSSIIENPYRSLKDVWPLEIFLNEVWHSGTGIYFGNSVWILANLHNLGKCYYLSYHYRF